MSDTAVLDQLKQEIETELRENTICIYSKGTRENPRCGFTMETVQFFDKLGVPFQMFDVLDNPPKRQFLNDMAKWPTLPKIFINGEFYGDTDVLGPMIESGELKPILEAAFPGTPIKL
jgi:monothiol glutaredoxin